MLRNLSLRHDIVPTFGLQFARYDSAKITVVFLQNILPKSSMKTKIQGLARHHEKIISCVQNEVALEQTRTHPF